MTSAELIRKIAGEMRDEAALPSISIAHTTLQNRVDAWADQLDAIQALEARAGAAVAWQWKAWNGDWMVTTSPAYSARLKDEGKDVIPLFAHPAPPEPGEARDAALRLAERWERIADEHGVRQFLGNDHRLFANELRAAMRAQQGNES